MTHMKRRDFLKLSALSAAALAAPTILVPRYARATEAFGAARHVLVLFAKGGMRSHCMFNAVGAFEHNPFGSQSAAPGTEWTLGAACGDVDLSTSLGVVPSFAKVTADVAVLACVDHNPGGAPDVGHDTATRRIGTGDMDGRNGLLSVVGAHHPLYAQGFSREALPPVEIGATDFGLGAGDYASRRPITLNGAGAGFLSDRPVGRGWKIGAREALDRRFLSRRSRAFARRLDSFHLSKTNVALFADLLMDPRLSLYDAPEAEDAGVTNAQLLEVLGDYDLRDIGDTMSVRSWGADVALALRFFSLGAPFCVVTRDIYDMHDDERDNYAPRVTDLARQLAGLHFLLQRMSHPEGGTYFDKTIVVVLSEFSRNNTFAETGFNTGNGSDHVPDKAGPSRNQAVPILGGPLSSRGRLFGSTDEAMNATGEVYSSRRLLATLLDVAGVSSSEMWSDAPIAELFQ